MAANLKNSYIRRDSISIFIKILQLVGFLLISPLSYATEDVWTAFWDDEHYKRGFKDKNGKVRIPPKFMGMTQATVFKNIIAVMEEKGEGVKGGEYERSYDSYYLLKDGRRIDSVDMFTFDNSFDCESDGKVRFRDKQTGGMGYLDGEGEVAIPAIYSIGQPFANGVASVLNGGTLMCGNGQPFSNENRCEHAHWQGGESLVIDASNNVILYGLSLGQEFDRYSLTISDNPLNDVAVESFKGVDGKFYNFINREKHFEDWFRQRILNKLSKTNLEKYSFEEITLYDSQRGWYKEPKSKFWANNNKTVLAALSLLKKEGGSFFVTMNNLNRGIYEEDKYREFYAECYNDYENKHPVLSVVANHKHKDLEVQNAFEFLKTVDGYKLISLTVRTAALN